MHRFEKKFIQDVVSTGVSFVAGAAQIALLVAGYDFNGFLLGFCLSNSFSQGIRLPRSYKHAKFAKSVLNSSFYKEYENAYHEYVKVISNKLLEMGCSPDLKAACMVKMALDFGFLSDAPAKYTLYEKDSGDVFFDVMGGRVATGGYCCRHSASLVTDVINEMGGVAADVACTMVKDKNTFVSEPSHMVTGLLHKDKKIMFDSTCDFVDMMNSGIVLVSDKGRKLLGQNGRGTYYKEGTSLINDGATNTNRLRLIRKQPALTDEDEYMEACAEAILEFTLKMDEMQEFYEEERPKIKQLSMMSQMVIPHGKAITIEGEQDA